MRESAQLLAVAAAQPVQTFSEFFQLATLPLHAHEIVTAALVYSTTFLYASPALSKWLLPAVYPQLPRRTKVNWNIRVTSLLQSTFISIFALLVIIGDDDRRKIDWQGRLWGYSRIGGTVQACAAGYFIWDVVVSARHIEVLGLGSLIHAICALLITCLGFRPFANYYGLRFILYELSTPFLNVHWFLDKLNMTGSKLQFWNGICLVAVFFACRLLWGSYQSVNLYLDTWSAWKASASEVCQPRWSSAKMTPHGLRGDTPSCAPAVPVWLLLLYLTSNTMLSILNCYWFGKMIEAVRKRFKAEPGRSE